MVVAAMMGMRENGRWECIMEQRRKDVARDAVHDPTGIVVGQLVTDEKLELSRLLRRRMTPAECVLWEAVRGNRLAGLRFRRQQIIDGFIVDFYCHAARLVVEVDGGIHEAQQGHDIARDQIIAGRALRVIRFTNDDVLNNLQDVLRQIVIAADSRPNPA